MLHRMHNCTYTTIVQLYLDFSMSKFGQFISNMCFKRKRKKTHNTLCLPLCSVPSIRVAQQLVYFAPKNANVAIGKNAKMKRERQSRFQTKINYGTTNFILLFVLFISRFSFCSLALHVCVCARKFFFAYIFFRWPMPCAKSPLVMLFKVSTDELTQTYNENEWKVEWNNFTHLFVAQQPKHPKCLSLSLGISMRMAYLCGKSALVSFRLQISFELLHSKWVFHRLRKTLHMLARVENLSFSLTSLHFSFQLFILKISFASL